MQPYDAYRALSDEQAARAAVPASPASHRLLKLACGCACVVLLLLACYIALCLWLPPSPGLTLARDEPLASAEPAIGAEGELFVIAMADWGGIPVYPYVTPAQLAVRSAMARAMSASAAKSKLVLALGDNFVRVKYFTGVTSASDPRFKATFEDVYVTDQPELGAENMFRLVAGNHDYGATKEISSQIAYSNQSKAWHFPAEYYTFSEPVAPAKPGGLPLVAQFVMIDTVLLAGGADGILDPQAAHARSEAHWAWLRATLSASTADYLVVAGHYPVWSVGWHGPTPFLVQALRPLLAENGVSAYFAGHDHCAEALVDGGVHHHGVGGAHGLDFGAPNLKAVPPGSLAFHYGGAVWPANAFKGTFAAISFGPRVMTVTHYDSDGQALLTLSQPPRPQRS